MLLFFVLNIFLLNRNILNDLHYECSKMIAVDILKKKDLLYATCRMSFAEQEICRQCGSSIFPVWLKWLTTDQNRLMLINHFTSHTRQNLHLFSKYKCCVLNRQ